MTYYSEYLSAGLNPEQVAVERKTQLTKISALRGDRDILVFASDLSATGMPISIEYSDRLNIQDQVASLSGKALDVILETPGGSGEVAEDIVRLLRQKYDDIAVIIPGSAMSAGTLIAMSANEILMEPEMSSLGPIDAQLSWQGKVFSAHALIAGFHKIKTEVDNTKTLSQAYIPILQGISPGELEHAQNALDFSKQLVTNWLAEYKFQNWEHHSTSGEEVTKEHKLERASEVAEQLCDHDHWKSHGRSIKLSDLNNMRLLVQDFSTTADLCEAIKRYYSLLRISFQSNLFKIIETPTSQILRHANVALSNLAAQQAPQAVEIQKVCKNCNSQIKVFAKLNTNAIRPPGSIPFPSEDMLDCPTCGELVDFSPERAKVEKDLGKIVE